MENIFNTLKKWREEFRCALPDSWYSKGTNKSINRKSAFCLDSSEEIIDRFFFISLYLEELITMISEIINRRHICHPAEFKKELDLLWSESINIYTMFTDEPFECLHLTSRTSRITTEESDFLTFFMCQGFTDRTVSRRENNFFSSCTRFNNGSYNLGDNFACTMDKYLISDSQIFFCNFVIVMKCCVLNSDSHDVHWFDMCDWCDSSRSSN